MISRVIIISRRASIASVNRAGVSGACPEPLSEVFRGWSPLRKFLGSREHLDLLKIDLNAAEIITVQDYKCSKINVNGGTHSVKAMSQRYNNNVKRPEPKENQHRILKTYAFC